MDLCTFEGKRGAGRRYFLPDQKKTSIIYTIVKLTHNGFPFRVFGDKPRCSEVFFWVRKRRKTVLYINSKLIFVYFSSFSIEEGSRKLPAILRSGRVDE